MGKETGSYALTLFNMASVYQEQGDLQRAISNLEDYCAIRKRVGIPLDDGDEDLLEDLKKQLAEE